MDNTLKLKLDWKTPSFLTEQAALSPSYGWGPTPPVCCSHTATRGHIPACSFNKTKAVICQRKTNTQCIGEWSIYEKIIPGQIHNHQILWHWIHFQLLQLCKQHAELLNIWVYKYSVPTTSMQNIIKVSTIVSSMQAFKGIATDSQVWERISVAAEEL